MKFELSSTKCKSTGHCPKEPTPLSLVWTWSNSSCFQCPYSPMAAHPKNESTPELQPLWICNQPRGRLVTGQTRKDGELSGVRSPCITSTILLACNCILWQGGSIVSGCFLSLIYSFFFVENLLLRVNPISPCQLFLSPISSSQCLIWTQCHCQ